MSYQSGPYILQIHEKQLTGCNTAILHISVVINYTMETSSNESSINISIPLDGMSSHYELKKERAHQKQKIISDM